MLSTLMCKKFQWLLSLSHAYEQGERNLREKFFFNFLKMSFEQRMKDEADLQCTAIAVDYDRAPASDLVAAVAAVKRHRVRMVE